MRVLFMGTPDFSVEVLKAIENAGHEIVAVYSQPPRPAGRGKKDRKTAVHAYAESRGLTVEVPLNFKDPETVTKLAAYNADVGVVVAYGLILPQAVLDAPRLGCLNVHASLLPRWRGAAPIQRAIEAGDAMTGVAIMQMDAGLDTGPEVSRIEVPITDDTTYASLHDELAVVGAKALADVIAADWTSTPQPAEGVTYAKKIDKAETAIDWSEPADVVARKIRAFSPFPGAFTLRDGERLKVLMAKAETGSGTPGEILGQILDDDLLIACGNEAIRISRIQPAGKPPMDVDAYLRGKPFNSGDQLPS